MICTLAHQEEASGLLRYFDAILHGCVWRSSLPFLLGALIPHNDFCGKSSFHNGQPCLVPYSLSGLDNTGMEYEHASEWNNPFLFFFWKVDQVLSLNHCRKLLCWNDIKTNQFFLFMHGFTKLFLKPGGTGTKLVWLSVAVNTANGGEPFGKRDGEIHFFFSFINEKANRVNYSSRLYHWRLNEWLPFSVLCWSPERLNGYILLTLFPT